MTLESVSYLWSLCPGCYRAELSEETRPMIRPPKMIDCESEWPICEACTHPIDPEEAQRCPSCGCDFHPECLHSGDECE